MKPYIATVIFSHMKISSFHAKAHLVFHWYLYNNVNIRHGDQGFVTWLKFIHHTNAQGGGTSLYEALMGMCCWMGLRFYDWIDYNARL